MLLLPLLGAARAAAISLARDESANAEVKAAGDAVEEEGEDGRGVSAREGLAAALPLLVVAFTSSFSLVTDGAALLALSTAAATREGVAVRLKDEVGTAKAGLSKSPFSSSTRSDPPSLSLGFTGTDLTAFL